MVSNAQLPRVLLYVLLTDPASPRVKFNYYYYANIKLFVTKQLIFRYICIPYYITN